jgi:hypothetical protein
VERELVLRLANVLWRLRRATVMETGLFEIQAEQLRRNRQSRQLVSHSQGLVHAAFGRADSDDPDLQVAAQGQMTRLPENGLTSGSCHRVRPLFFAPRQFAELRA